VDDLKKEVNGLRKDVTELQKKVEAQGQQGQKEK
jgi:hypothetical protein